VPSALREALLPPQIAVEFDRNAKGDAIAEVTGACVCGSVYLHADRTISPHTVRGLRGFVAPSVLYAVKDFFMAFADNGARTGTSGNTDKPEEGADADAAAAAAADAPAPTATSAAASTTTTSISSSTLPRVTAARKLTTTQPGQVCACVCCLCCVCVHSVTLLSGSV
jgi:hypothetical protein